MSLPPVPARPGRPERPAARPIPASPETLPAAAVLGRRQARPAPVDDAAFRVAGRRPATGSIRPVLSGRSDNGTAGFSTALLRAERQIRIVAELNRRAALRAGAADADHPWAPDASAPAVVNTPREDERRNEPGPALGV